MNNKENAGFIEAITQLGDRVKELEQENKELREALADTELVLQVLNS
jgi:hypothetical protein